jgi:hypothetical protein
MYEFVLHATQNVTNAKEAQQMSVSVNNQKQSELLSVKVSPSVTIWIFGIKICEVLGQFFSVSVDLTFPILRVKRGVFFFTLAVETIENSRVLQYYQLSNRWLSYRAGESR